MRFLLFAALLFCIASCSQKKWDKDTLVNDCLGDFTKRNEEKKMFSTMQVANMCNCLANKMLVEYKSMKEANKDEQGLQQMGRDCVTEAMEKTKY